MTFTEFLAEGDDKQCIVCKKDRETGSIYCRDCIDVYNKRRSEKYKKANNKKEK